jgi:hypothetical protein
MIRRWNMLFALVLLPTALPAAAPAVRDSLVLSHEFTTPRAEFVRIVLVAGNVYRFEVANAGQLQFRAREAGVQPPFADRIEATARPSNTVAFEIAPTVTAEYEVRVAGIRGAAPLRIYLDTHATERRQRVIASH